MSFMHRSHLGLVTLSFSLLATAATGLAACSADEAAATDADAGAAPDTGSARPDAARPPPVDTGDAGGPVLSYTVGGTITGLLGSGLVLDDNGNDRVTPAADGPFTFATPVASGSSYYVTVKTRPTNPAQVCTVIAGAGSIGSGNVADIAVKCSVASIAVGGTVVGLVGKGLVLQNEAGDDLPVSVNGAFKFATPLASGAPFAVTVKTQPTSPTQTCTVSGGTGTTGAGDVQSVVVNCGTNTYTVGGTVTGLVGSVVLSNPGSADLTLGANGSYAFPTTFASGKPYAVTVKAQPAGPTQQCTVSNGSGTVTNANITNVDVACQTSTYTIGGTYIGSAFTNGVVLQNNGADDRGTPGSSTFTFATPVPSGGTYNATVKSQGIDGYCYFSNASGTVTNANITSIVLNCPGHNTWTTVAPMPTPRDGAGASVGKDGRIYVIGGMTNFVPTGAVEIYSPITNTWTSGAPMPTKRWFVATATAPDGRIFVMGGNGSGGNLTTVEVYNPATNTWATAASLPEVMRQPGAALGADGRIYAFGTNKTDQYDIPTNAWVSIAQMRTPSDFVRAAAFTDGRIYVSGSTTIESFLPSGDTWAAGPAYSGSAAFVAFSGGSLYLVKDTMDKYTPGITGVVPQLPPSVSHVDGTGVAMPAPDGRVFAFGGVLAGGATHGVTEVYTP